MAEDYLQVTTTTDSRDEADRLARLAVEGRLAACAQVLSPISSTYWWQGQVETAEEWMVLVKTTRERVQELISRIVAEHSYDTPEVIATPIVSGNPAYLDWIATETRKSRAPNGS
jgi:periplasmic divalent cation tolerance protein